LQCRRALALASQRKAIVAHEHFKSCIDACNECAAACDYCAAACLKEPDVAKMARCVELDIDCAEICRLAAGYIARGSQFAADFCELCAQICEACGKECAKFQIAHCQECARGMPPLRRGMPPLASTQATSKVGQGPSASTH
jgi:hypothetical protein